MIQLIEVIILTEEKILIMGKSILSPVSKILGFARVNSKNYYKDVQSCLESLDYTHESSLRILVMIYLAARPVEDTEIFEEWEDIYNRFADRKLTEDDLIDYILDYEASTLYQYLSTGLKLLFEEEFLKDKHDEFNWITAEQN